MNSQLIANSKTTLIESDNKNNNERSSPTNYGTMNYGTNANNLNSTSNPNPITNEGWMSRATNCAYSVGSGVVNYGYGGLKWALSSTASVGTSVLSAGADGIVKIKTQNSKHKDE